MQLPLIISRKRLEDEIQKRVTEAYAPLVAEAQWDAFRSKLKATTKDRTKGKWYRKLPDDPNELISENLVDLRDMSRRLSIENNYLRKYVNSLVTNVVGPKGIVFSPQVRKGNSAKAGLNVGVNATLTKAFKEWKTNPWLNGKGDWVDFQDQGLTTTVVDGDCFVNIVFVDEDVNKYGTALEIIDGSLLDIKYNGTYKKHRIIHGIELDENDREVAYWFFNKHPGSKLARGQVKRQRLPACDPSASPTQSGIIHLQYISNDLVNSYRGLPWATAAIYMLARLEEYIDAEVIGAQIAADVVGFFTKDAQHSSYGTGPPVNTGTQITKPKDTTSDPNTIDLNQIFENAGLSKPGSTIGGLINVGKGSFMELPPGTKPHLPDFKRPNQHMPEFVKFLVHGIASALNMSYGSLASDQSEENYASGRLGAIEQRDYWKRTQAWLARSLHMKVYQVWLKRAMLSNNLHLPTDKVEDYLDVEWRGRGWKWADPKKDAAGIIELIKLNAMTITQIVEEFGGNFDEVLNERVSEIKKIQDAAEKAGIDPALLLEAMQSKPAAPVKEETE